MIELNVYAVLYSLLSRHRVVLLKEALGERYLPVWIGQNEAEAIAMRLQGASVPRPLTHDLMANLLRELSFEVESVVIDDLKNNIYYASIHLVSGARSLEIDSRPSDAIALALRTKSPIYVKKKVFALCMGLDKAAHESDKETLKQVLEDMEIDDAGGKIM